MADDTNEAIISEQMVPPEPVPMPISQQETSTNEDPLVFKALALKAVDNADSYDAAISGLKDAYSSNNWNNPDEIISSMQNYGEAAQKKFSIKPDNFDPFTQAPYPPNIFSSDLSNPYEKGKDLINQWE